MVKKVKGIKVSKQLQDKFKFDNDGKSKIGSLSTDVHQVTGTMLSSGSFTVEEEIVLHERIAGHLFSPPHVEGTDTDLINELINNIAEYEGFMIYLVSRSLIDPFVDDQKFYFCEDGEWHPSPFTKEITNLAPILNPTYEISVSTSGQDSSPFVLNLPSDLFIDQDGDAMTYTATMTNGNPLPAWLSFDATNTILSGTPTESDIGLLHVLITATDPSNASGTTTQEIQILAKPTPFWAGATHDFGTSGDPSWITVGAGNLLELNPSSGGSNAWHEAIAPDQFDISGSRTVIEFSTNNWLPSSAGGGDDNKFAVLLRKSSDVDNDFIGMQIHDDGQDDVRIAIAHAGYSGNTWQVTRQHSFSSDSYGPADEETYVDDLKYRLELGTLIPNPQSAVHYVLPVMIMAMRKTPPPTVVNAGYGDFTFEQLRDEDQYWAIPASIRDKYFARETYYWSINNSANLPLSEYTTFQPSVWALKDTAVNSPLMNFETFQISQDDIPEVNTDYIFVDWAAMEGQAFSETIPADLFVDPEGETPLAYVATQDDFSALPSWLTFDPATLTFSGTPAGSDAPGLTVMVRGFDSATEAADQVYGSAGNQKLFTVTVTEAPVGADPQITILGQSTMTYTVNATANYIDDGAMAIDAEDGNISSDIEISGDIVNLSVPGTYTIFYDVTDSDGNKAAQKSRTVTVSPLDSDGDGTPDNADAFPADATETQDSDGDGVGDNADAFPLDASETADTDGDGVGDNADAFPLDASETADTDGDGVGDNADAFPLDASETADSDGDGVGDNADAFPADASETADTDGDGVGDNADAFPADASETQDSDGDGVGDNADAFPADASETQDSDGDGVGDNADAFPADASETADTDGDGVGDNADAFPTDPLLSDPITFTITVHTDKYARSESSIKIDGVEHIEPLSNPGQQAGVFTETFLYDPNGLGYSTIDIGDPGYGDAGIMVEFDHPDHGVDQVPFPNNATPVYALGSLTANSPDWPGNSQSAEAKEGPLPVRFKYTSPQAEHFEILDEQNNVLISSTQVATADTYAPYVVFDGDLIVNETHPHSSDQERYSGWRLFTAMAGDVLSVDPTKFNIQDLDDDPANSTIHFSWRSKDRYDNWIYFDDTGAYSYSPSSTSFDKIIVPKHYSHPSADFQVDTFEGPHIYLIAEITDADGNVKTLTHSEVGQAAITAANDNETELWMQLTHGLTPSSPVNETYISVTGRNKELDSVHGDLVVLEGDIITYNPSVPNVTMRDPNGNDLAGGTWEPRWRSRAIINGENEYQLSNGSGVFRASSEVNSFAIPPLTAEGEDNGYEYYYLEYSYIRPDNDGTGYKYFPPGTNYPTLHRVLQVPSQEMYEWAVRPIQQFDELWTTTGSLNSTYEANYITASNSGSFSASHFSSSLTTGIVEEFNSIAATVNTYFPNTSGSAHSQKYETLSSWISDYEDVVAPLRAIIKSVAQLHYELGESQYINPAYQQDYGVLGTNPSIDNLPVLWDYIDTFNNFPDDWTGVVVSWHDRSRFTDAISDYPNSADWATAMLAEIQTMKQDLQSYGYDDTVYSSLDWGELEVWTPINFTIEQIDFDTMINTLTTWSQQSGS